MQQPSSLSACKHAVIKCWQQLLIGIYHMEITSMIVFLFIKVKSQVVGTNKI